MLALQARVKAKRRVFLRILRECVTIIGMTTVHPVNTDIARNIRAVLAVYDLPQKILVDWLAVHEGQVSKLMANRQEWRVTHLAAIAERVGVSLAVLIGPTAELVKSLPPRLSTGPGDQDPFIAPRPGNAQRKGSKVGDDQLPTLSDVQFVTDGTCETPSRHPIAA